MGNTIRMKTLEDTRKEKAWWENQVREKEIEYSNAKKLFKTTEANLKTIKKSKNKTERELKFGRKQVIKINNRISSTPSRVRKWGKEHPGELIKTLGEGT